MRIRKGIWQGLGTLAVVLSITAALFWLWIIPGAITGRLRILQGGGRVVFDRWWLSAGSSGLTHLRFHEGPEPDAPAWLVVDRVDSGLTLGGVIRGQTTPRQLVLLRPEVTIRLDASGQVLTPLRFQGIGGDGVAPRLELRDGTIRFQQADRPDMVVRDIDGVLEPTPQGWSLTARTRDPRWGRWRADGTITADLNAGKVEFSGLNVAATPEKVASLPFVSPGVWAFVVPEGPVDVRQTVEFDQTDDPPLRCRTWVNLRGTDLRLPTLGVTVAGTRGEVVYEGGVTRFRHCNGQALDGSVGVDGSVDFNPELPEIQLELRLDEVAVADAPKVWQLGPLGVTAGQMSGTARIRAIVGADQVDLTGTTGEAVVTRAVLREIPVKSLTLQMQAEGPDLKYVTTEPQDKPTIPQTVPAPDTPAIPAPSGFTARLLRSSRLMSSLTTLRSLKSDSKLVVPIEALVSVREPHSPTDGDLPETTHHLALRLPSALSSEIELEDVDLKQLVDQAARLGMRLPFDASGRISIQARATIPLGTLHDLKSYSFQGEATLKGASIAGVDLGRLQAAVRLQDGVLELTEFRGRMIDPMGAEPDEIATEAVAVAASPLADGAYRVTARAELSPPGRVTAQAEASNLPLGPWTGSLSHLGPWNGLVSLDAHAESSIERIGELTSWTAQGQITGRALSYATIAVDHGHANWHVQDGTLHIPALTARFQEQSLDGLLSVSLAAPHVFHATLNGEGWELADALSRAGVHPAVPVSGRLEARAQIRGTLLPLAIVTEGTGRLAEARAGPTPWGAMTYSWATEEEEIVVNVPGAQSRGGHLSAQIRIPTRPDRSVRGDLVFREIDTATLAPLWAVDGLKLAGKADGQVAFTIPSTGPTDFQANLQLSAPLLTFQGLPTERLQASLWVRDQILHYEIGSESLGGRVRFQGAAPWGRPVAGEPRLPPGRFQAAGFSLAALLARLGIAPGPALPRGSGAIDANVRLGREREDLSVAARLELRDLGWGPASNSTPGSLSGVARIDPSGWKLEAIQGQLWGGDFRGSASGPIVGKPSAENGDSSPRFEAALLRADLGQAIAPWPALSTQIEGTGSLKARGRWAGTWRMDGDLEIPSAIIAGLPVAALQSPVRLDFDPDGSAAVLMLNGCAARLAGGNARGHLRLSLGASHGCEGDARLVNLDLATLARELGWNRPASGRVQGQFQWNVRDWERFQGVSAQVKLNLDDAELFALPIFRELARFLGVEAGVVFRRGQLAGTCNDHALLVDHLALEGRWVQLVMRGSVGYDGQLDLVAFVSTQQVIPQSGMALVATIPGMGAVLDRRDEALARFRAYLAPRLLKIRVRGTLSTPDARLDSALFIPSSVVDFFAGVLQIPMATLP